MIALDPSTIDTDAITPEQRLFVAVILNAITDAVRGAPVKPREMATRQRERDQARRWFKHAGADFREVCYHAGLEPDAVRAACLAYIEDNERDPIHLVRQGWNLRGRRKRVTLRDVANHAGVSLTIIQRVRGSLPGVAADTRQRVKAAFAELGYRSV